MNNNSELLENSDYLDLINGLPELELKLKSIQKFLRKITKVKSPEKIKAMLPLLGFSIVGDNIEYDFGDFSVKFPIEKCFTRSVSLEFSKSLISENLSDALSGENFSENGIN